MSGSLQFPLPLADALRYDRIQAGSTIWMRGGVYADDFISLLHGTKSAPITIRPYKAERVIIDGGFNCLGAHTVWRDIEFCNSGWSSRETDEIGSEPSFLPSKWELMAEGVRLINCFIHDIPNIGAWSEASGAEIYGCIFLNNGWNAPDRPHGYNLYSQNETTPKRIENNFFGSGFSNNLVLYSVNSALKNYLIARNTFFGTSILSGLAYTALLIGSDGVEPQNVSLESNRFFNSGYDIHFWTDNLDCAILNNYCPSGMLLNALNTRMTVSGNIEHSIGNRIYLEANIYDHRRAHLTIYNEAQADSVQVDVSNVLSAGRAYKLRNVQDYFVDIQEGTVAQDGTITIDMQASNRSVQVPIAWSAPATTFPDFGCFVLEAV